MLNPFKKTQPDSPQFSWQETPPGIRFAAETGDLPLVEYAANLPIDAYSAQAQWMLLKELLDNGQAESSDSEILVPHEELCGLSAEEYHLLGLPEPYPFDLEIRSKGTLNEPDFRYEYQFQQPDRKPLYPTRTGCVLRFTETWSYVLTRDQYTLLETLDAFNSREGGQKDFQSNLLEFARIKGIAHRSGVELDRYLNQENVVAPATIRLRLKESGDGVEITPEVEGVDNDKLEEVFDQFPDPEETYNLSDEDGIRTRVVFKEEQQDALRAIKEHRRVSKDKLLEIAEQSQAYFDPDVVELDPTDDAPSFSERVLKIGTYRPRLYPFISPYKSEWIPGVIIEDEAGTQSQIKVKSEEEFADLKQAVQRAKETGQSQMTWKDWKLPVSDVEALFPFMEEQLKHREKRPRSAGEKPENPVLIIEENIEDPGYVEDSSDGPIEEPFRHLLEFPPNLKSDVGLLPHQEEGLAWMQQLWHQSYPGGLLADDMGLGKTLQVLGFLEWLRARGHSQLPVLIIAPIALLENWMAEHPKFFVQDGLRIVMLYGEELNHYKLVAGDESNQDIPGIEGFERIRELRRRRGALDVGRLRNTDIVLTTYETVRDFQLDLGLIHWAVVVTDEAQKIKSPGTLVTNAAKALKTDFRIALTGTPVENSLMDLWCITDFVAPGYLGSAMEFDRRYCKPLERVETDIRSIGDEIRNRIGVHFKRRLKTDILDDLPKKHIHDTEVCQKVMPPQQYERYQTALSSTQETDSAVQNAGSRILQTIHQLKDISDHPLLADSKWDGIPTAELIAQSAKLTVTVQILERIQAADEKAILFSDRRNTQKLLSHVIGSRFSLRDISIVNGETPGSARRANSMKMSRQQAVDRFQASSGFNVIIMSPLAAGVGLNITEANHVIHYSRWWNPAKEDQASDRVYRIGQTRPVHIYCPMAIHPKIQTFDLILHQLLDRKRELSKGTLFPTERAEVTPAELMDQLLQTPARSEGLESLSLEDVDRLEPERFEAFVATLYEKQGYRVELTPQSGDKGVDVVAIPISNEETGILVQVKQSNSKGKPGLGAIQEIVAAKLHFQIKHGIKFEVAVVTNQKFTKDAHQLGRVNNVHIHERKWLIQRLKESPVTRMDIDRCWIRNKRR